MLLIKMLIIIITERQQQVLKRQRGVSLVTRRSLLCPRCDSDHGGVGP